MNITEQDIKSIIFDIRADIESLAESNNEFEFEIKKSKARYQMQGILKVVTPFKISSFVLVQLGHLKSIRYAGDPS